MNGFFITGTDTDAGKTWFTAALTRALRRQGIPALAIKPISCGGRADAEIYAKANDETLSLNDINPLTLAPPLAPYAACVIEDKPLDMDAVRNNLEKLGDLYPGPFLVEGVGGWLVPLTHDFMVSDWAREIGLPVVIVCRAGLGTINHTLLTVEAVRRTGLPIAGIAMNYFNTRSEDLAVQTNAAVIEDLSKLPLFKFETEADFQSLPKWLQP